MEQKVEAQNPVPSPPKAPEVKAEKEEKKSPAPPAEEHKQSPEPEKRVEAVKQPEQKESPPEKAESEAKMSPEPEQEASKEEEKLPAKGRIRAEDYVMPTTFEVEIHLEDNQVTDKLRRPLIDPNS